MPQNVQYIASYKLFNGKYYINHIKGELFFKVNKRRKLSNSPLHIVTTLSFGRALTLYCPKRKLLK